MIRRALLVAAAAAAFILGPSAAMAYTPPGFTFTVSDATPAAGAPFTSTVTGVGPSTQVTLGITSNPASISNSAIQIAGAKTFAKTANASGVATFTATLSAAGTYALTATSSTGAVVGTQTVTVAGAGAAAAAAPGGQLSRTGFDAIPFAVGGGLLVLAGAGAVVVARRRRSARVHA
jgi:hypothetical protein